MRLKIGELARRTGLTVRALHHYDAIELLRPSIRTAAGHRLYDREDIQRLHRIQALRQLDIPLSDIAALLEGEAGDIGLVIDQQLAALDERIARAGELRQRLAALREQVRDDREPELDDWLATLSLMSFYDRYFDAEEIALLRRHSRGDSAAFRALREQLRTRMRDGAPPDSPDTLALARRWIALSVDTLAGDARLVHKADALHRNDPTAHFLTGIDPELLDYITRATAEFRFSLYARHLDAADAAPARERFLRHYLEWPGLFAEARELHERGVDALSPEALDLARRWIALFIAVWGTDPRLHERIRAINDTEPELVGGMGIAEEAIRRVQRGIAHLRTLKNEMGGTHEAAGR